MNPNDLKALVIEDDPDVLLGCEQALQLEGICTVGVESAEKAIKLIRTSLPGIIISGYAEGPSMPADIAETIVLTKPFSIEQMDRAIREGRGSAGAG